MPVLDVPALHRGPAEDLLDLTVPPLVGPGAGQGPAHDVLLPCPHSPGQHSGRVSHQPRPLPPGLRPVANVEDRVGEVNPHIHHFAGLVLTLVHCQIYLTAAQPSVNKARLQSVLSPPSLSPQLGHVVRRPPRVSLGEVIIVQAAAGALELHVPRVVEDGAEHVGVDVARLRAWIGECKLSLIRDLHSPEVTLTASPCLLRTMKLPRMASWLLNMISGSTTPLTSKLELLSRRRL